jgi:hypothetical protein
VRLVLVGPLSEYFLLVILLGCDRDLFLLLPCLVALSVDELFEEELELCLRLLLLGDLDFDLEISLTKTISRELLLDLDFLALSSFSKLIDLFRLMISEAVACFLLCVDPDFVLDLLLVTDFLV